MFFRRRFYYKPLIHKPDFFIIHYIYIFIKSYLGKYIHKEITVLDIGCGEQPWRRAIEELGGAYSGVDIVQNAQNSVDILSNIVSIPVKNQSYDVILCSEVLEHVLDTSDAFMEMTRIIKPGGYIILTTPFAYPLHEEPFDFVRLTPHNIVQQAERNGLDIVTIQTKGNEFEVLATTIDNMFIRIYPSNQPLVYKIVKILIRITINILTLQLSCFLGAILPSKSYLSVQAVLRKPPLV